MSINRLEVRQEGVVYGPRGQAGDSSADREAVAFLDQLEDLGLTRPLADGITLVPWSTVYAALGQDDLVPSDAVLPLPPVDLAVVPALRSALSLSDEGFRITVAGWHQRGHGQIAERLSLVGPVCAELPGRAGFMLSEEVWRLIEALTGFHARGPGERSPEGNRLAWGEIRDLALQAGAVLDGFLRSTVVLRPRMLSLGLERILVGDDVAVRVTPTFDGAPEGWLAVFDRSRDSGVYKVVDPDGGYHEVVAEDSVRQVLTEIKRLPNRTAAGPRARRLIENPFAFFDADDASVFDEQAVEAELERLRNDAWGFRPQIDLDAAQRIRAVGIEIEPLGDSVERKTEVRLFASAAGLDAFVDRAASALTEGHSFFAWGGFELELDREAEAHLDILRRATKAWDEQQQVDVPSAASDQQRVVSEEQPGGLLIDASMVLDLSRYHDRIDSIGVETKYGIISIPLGAKGAWLPEGAELRLLPADPSDETGGLALDRDGLREFVAAVGEAEAAGQTSVVVPGRGPIELPAARDLVDALPKALLDEINEPAPERPVTARQPARPRTGLLIKPNIDAADYVTHRSVALRPPDGAAALVPQGLRPDVQLKDHQLSGLLWLQYLFAESPARCHGALLADDMGLGKTLQALALIARAREDDPDLAPALVVAPVTLLENWGREVERFFEPGSLPVQTLYGEGLRQHRVGVRKVDQRLRDEGLKRFLRPGWTEGAAIVLTTYETLRDYEFSFGDVPWSIVVCDEAQRIKNPNALVTRAAKKLNARFCVAATGTPVENNLTDLWSLFDFIQPGLLEPLNRFNRNYRRPIEAKTEDERERIDELRRLIDPQILRRTKADVARDLPEKRLDQTCRRLKMTVRQLELYRATLDVQRSTRPKQGTEILQVIADLRYICTDPRSRRERADPLPTLAAYRSISPKLDWLVSILESIESAGEKAIVFVERKDIQRLVQAYVSERFGFAPEIINGETPTSDASAHSRQKRIDRFQAKPGFNVLILSPVAAGVGLNIQAANHVIHYMRHWNPAKEDQATDRAYRIGQTRDVTVYTPIVEGDGWVSFDERLDELLEKKRAIAANMLNGSDDIGAAEFVDLIV